MGLTRGEGGSLGWAMEWESPGRESSTHLVVWPGKPAYSHSHLYLYCRFWPSPSKWDLLTARKQDSLGHWDRRGPAKLQLNPPTTSLSYDSTKIVDWTL